MIDSLVTLGGIAAAALGAIWYAFTRGKASESVKRDAATKQAEIETMERINADNPHAGLPVDERLQRHTGKR